MLHRVATDKEGLEGGQDTAGPGEEVEYIQARRLDDDQGDGDGDKGETDDRERDQLSVPFGR